MFGPLLAARACAHVPMDAGVDGAGGAAGAGGIVAGGGAGARADGFVCPPELQYKLIDWLARVAEQKREVRVCSGGLVGYNRGVGGWESGVV
jgi:hypothetical protein